MYFAARTQKSSGLFARRQNDQYEPLLQNELQNAPPLASKKNVLADRRDHRLRKFAKFLVASANDKFDRSLECAIEIKIRGDTLAQQTENQFSLGDLFKDVVLRKAAQKGNKVRLGDATERAKLTEGAEQVSSGHSASLLHKAQGLMNKGTKVHPILLKRLQPVCKHQARHGNGAQQIGEKQIGK